MKKAGIIQPGAEAQQANTPNGNGNGLALPYSMRKGNYLIAAGRAVYPVTISEILPNFRLLGRDTRALMHEFSGGWGRSMVFQIEQNHIVFPDSVFSKALVYSLILESKGIITKEAAEAMGRVPLCDREFSAYTHSLLQRFLSSSLAQRLDAKSPDLADDLRAHILNSKVFALVFDVLASPGAQQQYEKGTRSGNPYKAPESLEWICPGRGSGVGVSLPQVAYMIGRISPKLAHPDLVSYVTGVSRNDLNVQFMGRLKDLCGILNKFGITPNGDDMTASYILAKNAFQAANAKIKNGMEVKEYFGYVRSRTIREITIHPDRVFSRLANLWLADGQVMFWQGIADASRKSLYADAKRRMGEGAPEDDVQQFAGYAGQFIFFKFRGCGDLGLTQRHGLYRKIIENGILAIHEGDLPGLKREVQTLMLMSPTIYSDWNYLHKSRDSSAFGIFSGCPQLALCALEYITPSDAAKVTRRLGMEEKTFLQNAGEFRAAHKRLSEAIPLLSDDFRGTAQEICGKLDTDAERAIREVGGRLGFSEPVQLDTWQRKEQRAADELEQKYSGKEFEDKKKNTWVIKMVVKQKGHLYAVQEMTDANGKVHPKVTTALFTYREIIGKRLVPKKAAKPGA
ncbi:MAG: hypothetical protein WC861_06195 [Candidatus Micrarchaeia archaeon]|jgi:hypothetical protein